MNKAAAGSDGGSVRGKPPRHAIAADLIDVEGFARGMFAQHTRPGDSAVPVAAHEIDVITGGFESADEALETAGILRFHLRGRAIRCLHHASGEGSHAAKRGDLYPLRPVRVVMPITELGLGDRGEANTREREQRDTKSHA